MDIKLRGNDTKKDRRIQDTTPSGKTDDTDKNGKTEDTIEHDAIVQTDREDAQSKKRKHRYKESVLTAILLVLLASAGFVSQYPRFGHQASSFVAEFREDVMKNETFLCNLYTGNIVLYKELQEQVTGHLLSYQDLYLSVTEEPCHDAAYAYIDLNGESVGEYASRKLYELSQSWENILWNILDHTVDYQITDHTSGTTIANTGNNIILLGTEEASEELLAAYPYYIKMRYDDAGFLEHVWVKGVDADSLLKNVQRVMKSSFLERELYDSFGFAWDKDIYYYRDDEKIKAQIDVSDTPRNCTVCYALTQGQKDHLVESNFYHQEVDSRSAYYSVGVTDVFRLFLIILGILALILPLSKRYHLHELRIFRFHLEILIAALFILFIWMGDMATALVIFTTKDGVNSALAASMRSYLPNLSMKYLEIMAIGVNILLVSVMFGLWYILVTGLGQVYTLGLMQYIKERSLCYRIFHRFYSFGTRKAVQLKEEILHVDLGQNINRTLFKIVAINYLLLTFLSMLWFAGVFLLLIYSAVLYMALKKYIRHIQEQYRYLLAATKSIADGNLQTEFSKDWGIFASYKSQLEQIQSGFSKAVEEEVKSQRMRTELITNVSHDLKTPLTAITTYIELLQEEGVTKEQQREYLDVLARKALRLKTLIEDLFEVSKATSGNVTFQPEKVDIGNLMRQAYLEYEDKVQQANLTFRFRIPEEKQFLMLDSQKTYRIFENLYTNIIKYAMPHTRVYVCIKRHNEDVVIELKNMSKAELNIPPESLTERFVRGDSSRNTEGSGLGLAIARSFVELQKGKMQVDIDGDLFKVTIVWKGL